MIVRSQFDASLENVHVQSVQAKGLIGRILEHSKKSHQEQRAVSFDGFHYPVEQSSINYMLDVLPDDAPRYRIVIQMKRPREFEISVTDDEENEIFGFLARTSVLQEGILCALEMFLSSHTTTTTKNKGPILVELCDLNLCLTLNRVVAGCGPERICCFRGGRSARLGSRGRVYQRLKRILEKTKLDVWFKFYQECEADCPGSHSYDAFKRGTFSFHPKSDQTLVVKCEHKQHPYHPAATAKTVLNDWGINTVLAYTEHAASMCGASRLKPNNLFVLDPAMFWLTVFHFETFIDRLTELPIPSRVFQEWADLIGKILVPKHLAKVTPYDAVNAAPIDKENGHHQLSNLHQLSSTKRANKRR